VDVGHNALSGTFTRTSGDIVLEWDALPASAHLIVTYQFDNESWEIVGFDPVTREVCVSINSAGSTKTVSVILPSMSPSTL
jgi:hypothetical protein